MEKAIKDLADKLEITEKGDIMEKAVKELANKFEITDKGDIDEYLGVKVEKQRDRSIKMSQPLLIRQILEVLGFNERTKGKSTPAIASMILHGDIDGEQMETKWEYASMIGQMDVLEKSTRPDLAYAVHQCAQFSANPKASHKVAFLCIRKYLMETKNE